MSKPRVLVFIDWYAPFFKAGGPVRSMVNLVEHLHGSVDFYIVTGDRDYTATEPQADLQTDQWVDHGPGVKVWYASQQARSLSAWRRILGEGHWDTVYINGLYSRWSTIIPLWLLRSSKQRRIVAVRGMLAPGPMRQSAIKKRAFLFGMKALGCFKGVEFQATNTDEVKDIVQWMGNDAKIHLVPNLARRVPAERPAIGTKQPGELRLVSLARISPEKNTLFAIEQLKELKGNVRFDLHGAVYDQAYAAQCRTAIEQLPANIQVHLHGHLPQEAGAEVLAGSHALFMPSVGENFGHTMLESLLVGRPLLISDRTPWKQLQGSSAGWDLPLEDPTLFVKALQELVNMDQANYDRLAEGAFALGARYLADPVPVQCNLAMFLP